MGWIGGVHNPLLPQKEKVSKFRHLFFLHQRSKFIYQSRVIKNGNNTKKIPAQTDGDIFISKIYLLEILAAEVLHLSQILQCHNG